MPFINEKNNSRTIDHERGFVLRNIGGGISLEARKEREFSLSIGEEIFKFTAEYNTNKDSSGDISLDWVVTNIAPLSTDNVTNEFLKKIIIDSMLTYGMFYENSNIANIQVQILSK